MSEDTAKNLVKSILEHIEGETAYEGDELREGLRHTPQRVVTSWKELYSG